MKMPSYKESNYGNWPYNISEAIRTNQTYCNQAVYLTIRTLDKNWSKFVNEHKDKDGNYIRNSEFVGNGESDAPWGRHTDYTGRTSNYWCKVLEWAAAKNKEIVQLKTMEEAQYYANKGYIVIGAYLNKTRSPHFVTVSPGNEYSSKEGAFVAHVGAGTNKEKRVFDTNSELGAFSGIPSQNINWYYNKQQELRLDWVRLNQFRWRAK